MRWNEEDDLDSDEDVGLNVFKQRNQANARKQFRKVHNGQRNRKNKVSRESCDA